MTSILMVCLGNICRSPLAEGILKSKLPLDSFCIDSAGTSNFHSGHQPDPRSVYIAKIHGIDISNQQARQFTTRDFENFDYIFAMDKSNYDNIVALSSSEQEAKKVALILDHHNEVPDPYYGGENGFREVFELLDDACQQLAYKLLNTSK